MLNLLDIFDRFLDLPFIFNSFNIFGFWLDGILDGHFLCNFVTIFVSQMASLTRFSFATLQIASNIFGQMASLTAVERQRHVSESRGGWDGDQDEVATILIILNSLFEKKTYSGGHLAP